MEEAVSTNRLILRKTEIHDHTAVYEHWAREPEITKYLTWRPHKSPEETRSFIQQCINDWDSGTRFPFVIYLKSTKDVIGMIEFRIDNFKAEIGYVLCKKYWGHGYMTEALQKMVDLLFSQEKIPGSGAEEIAKALETNLKDLLPVRLVSHHMRLLGLLKKNNQADVLVLVDYDDTK